MLRVTTPDLIKPEFWGQMLFLIYTNDLPAQLESSCAIFADDTTVHAASSDSNLSSASISADLDVAAGMGRQLGHAPQRREKVST